MARTALIQLRRDTAANWTSTNPTLAAGEMGFETNTGRFKIGTGSTAWTSLLYATDGSEITGSLRLQAGTATAGTAPLYLTSGTNLTTAAAGAMEFDGTNLYFSPSTTRKTVAFTDSAMTSSHFIGTTSVALNRASANLALTGITSVAMPGSTSGTTTLQASAAAGTTTITLPAVTGTVVTTGDTGSVSNTMLATISTAGKVSNSATTATSADTGSAIVARDGSNSFNARTGYFEGGYLGGLDYTNAVSAGIAGSLTTNGLGVIRVGKYSTGVTGITINHQQAAGSGTSYHLSFYRQGTNVGSISDNGSNTAFNTSSDYRLKENVKELEGALVKINALQPKTYNFITTPEITQDGFLAHELQEVLPYAVTGEKDALDNEGNIRPQQVDYSKLAVLLVGAVQELSAQVQELSARVMELENNQ